MPSMLVAVHGGAGTHRCRLDALCAKAARGSNGDVVHAIKILEDDPLTNAGVGSNLTSDGHVECEAAFFSSNQSIFGAIGAVGRIRNPIVAAYELAKEQLTPSIQHLVSPSVLVAQGAEQWARSIGVEMCEPDELITQTAFSDKTRAERVLAGSTTHKLDTVGAVSVNSNGECTAGCSSGGILLKRRGRLGHAVQMGGAVWAEQTASRSVAVSLSGCGEFIAKTCLAQRIANALIQENDDALPMQQVKQVFEKEFIRSPLLASLPSERILAGGLVLLFDANEKSRELIVFHNTEHFPFAFSDGTTTNKSFSKRTSGSPFIMHSFPSYFPHHLRDGSH